jgi:hypothetical protein
MDGQAAARWIRVTNANVQRRIVTSWPSLRHAIRLALGKSNAEP